MSSCKQELGLYFKTLTGDVQEESGGVITQHVLCQRGDTKYSRRSVDVFDSLLSPAQVGVRDGCAVTKIQLDVCLQGVALKQNSRASVPTMTNCLE